MSTDGPLDHGLIQRALATPGYFHEDEADLLMECVASIPADTHVLEVGCYHGRSTLFGLAALPTTSLWFSIDSFRRAAGYQDHTLLQTSRNIRDHRWRLIPTTLEAATPHLTGLNFGLAFVDGDHSFIGASTDIARCISLLVPGRRLLCHDYTPLFPGVMHTVDTMVTAGVVKPKAQVRTLIELVVTETPPWLIDPRVAGQPAIESDET